MSSGTAASATPPKEPRVAVRADSPVDRRLRLTQRQVKIGDVCAGLILLAIGVLGYLTLAAVIDHWIVPSGLGVVGRSVLFVGLVATVAAYLIWFGIPQAVGRINPIYAAQTIEQGRPWLRNSLINLLYLRRERRAEGDPLAQVFCQALEQKAAADLTRIPPETAVDRSHLIRLGYVLIGVVAVACLYLVLSPKSTLASFGRVVMPWADVKAPTRVTIEGVEPGDAVAYQGDRVTVWAKVDGLRDDEAVLLYYTTADGQSVNEAIPMTVPEGHYRYRCELPPGRFGLQRDVEYYLAAGDCRTRRFALDVETALSIVVDRVEYDFPAYTGIADRVDRGAGDLKAVEGTKVTLRAAANQDIDRASVELDGDSRRAVHMKVEGSRTATAGLVLRMDRNRPARPEFTSYQLRFVDTSGRTNRRPIRHEVEVIPDLPPIVRLVDPPDDEMRLPWDGAIDLRLSAEDPDFGLRRVALRAERDGRSLPIPSLLERPRPEAAHEGRFEGAYRFEPSTLGLEPGQVIVCWGEAEDNKEPTANRAETERRRIVIAPPERAETTDPSDAESPTKPDPRGAEAAKQPPETPDGAAPESPDAPQDPPDREQEPARDDPGESPSAEAPGRSDSEPPPSDPSEAKPESSEQDGRQSTGQQPKPEEGPEQQQQDEQGDSDASQQGTQAQPAAGGEAPSSDEPSGQGAEGSKEPIDGDTNPGEAFEQILRHREEKGESQPEQGPSQGTPGSESSQAGGTGEAGGTEGAGEAAAQPSPGDAGEATAKSPPDQATAPQSETGEAEPGQSKPSGDSETDGPIREGEVSGGEPGAKPLPDPPSAPQSQPGGADVEPKPGEGEETRSKEPAEAAPDEAGKPRGEESGPSAGDPKPDRGEPGAGKPGDDEAGGPLSEEAARPRDKQLELQDRAPPEQGEPAPPPPTRPKESDSRGETSGDRSGGGEEGAGQRSPQSGTGAAGSQTASDEGGATSAEEGQGETGGQAGEQVQADRPTGQASEQQGPGSRDSSQPGGGDQGQPQPDGQPGEQSGSTDGPGTPQAGSASGGARPDVDQSGSPTSEPNLFRGEKANLEYAEKQTDLALEYLEDQLAKDQPDQGLLDRLGWTRDDLESFYRRWRQMKRAVQGSDGETARDQLDKALQSLGLEPRGTSVEGGRTPPDRSGGLKEGFRFDPPPAYRDAWRAYRKGLAEQ